jgi:SAM-dependent methyltransferase
MNEREETRTIQARYAEIAKATGGRVTDKTAAAMSLGYSEDDLDCIPSEANLGLSCGNPTGLAGLQEGEVVLDLGSGAGFDCFLAAQRVGPDGKVIGVDMTPEMVDKARQNAAAHEVANVEFREGHIEHLPVEDESVDVVLSNCVIVLSTDKAKVFQEIYRVLKPGGRIAISDMALLQPLQPEVQNSLDDALGCVSRALLIADYERMVEAAGLRDVTVTVQATSACLEPASPDPFSTAIRDSLSEGESWDQYVVSINVQGHK